VSLLIEISLSRSLARRRELSRNLLREQSYTLFGNARSPKSQILIFAVSVLLMILLQWVIFKTKVGTAMRAVSFNLNSAKLMGINTDFIISSLSAGSALAAAAGGIDGSIQPQIDPLDGLYSPASKRLWRRAWGNW